ARAARLEFFEPGDEGGGIGGSLGCGVGDLPAQFFEKAAFQAQHRGIASDTRLPIVGREGRREALAVPFREAALKRIVEELRSTRIVKRQRGHEITRNLKEISISARQMALFRRRDI